MTTSEKKNYNKDNNSAIFSALFHKNTPSVKLHLRVIGLSLNNVHWKRRSVREILGSKEHRDLT